MNTVLFFFYKQLISNYDAPLGEFGTTGDEKELVPGFQDNHEEPLSREPYRYDADKSMELQLRS
jgi:hypothetical protein